jgi:two-component system cell cycle response regulator
MSDVGDFARVPRMEEGTRQRVLLVDDDRLQREMASDSLSSLVDLECCSSAEEALASLERTPAAVVVSDLTMPGMSGMELLRSLRRGHPGTDFVLITANASIESAVEALRMGAADYLLKPVSWEELRLVLERVLLRRRLVDENERLRETLGVVESCRFLASCLEAPDVHGVSLGLTLGVTGRERGLAVYRRPSAISDGLELRGFREDEVSRLRRILGKEKPIDLTCVEQIEIQRSGPVRSALREAGLGDEALLAVPIPGEESEHGLLIVPDGGREFSAEVLERVGVVAAHATIALRNAERYERAKERAFIDDVTEVYNARYLLEALERELRRAERYRTSLSVLFLDLDRFKLVNDHHGHLVGSDALRQLSRHLLSCVRQVDTLARYGGDEFTIVLPDTEEPAAAYVAERIRRVVAETPFDASPGEVMRLTCSIGYAVYPHHGTDRASLLDAADKAMYRAKSLGRDRCCSATELAG